MSDDKRVRAITLREEGKSIRAIAQLLGISKSTIGRWFQDADYKIASKMPEDGAVTKAKVLVNAIEHDIKISDRYSEYIDSLASVKDRQVKWAEAVTETGTRALSLANKFVAKLEQKEELDRSDFELLKLVPNLMNCSASAIKSAAEAEDRAYSLEVLVDILHELPHQVKAANRKTDLKSMVANS